MDGAGIEPASCDTSKANVYVCSLLLGCTTNKAVSMVDMPLVFLGTRISRPALAVRLRRPECRYTRQLNLVVDFLYTIRF